VTKPALELLSKSAVEGNIENLFQRLESTEKASTAAIANNSGMLRNNNEESKDNLSEAEVSCLYNIFVY
jgi:hypothetical protein